MAENGEIWAVATRRGQTPDRLWHTPESGPFQIDPSLFSSRWMRKAQKAEVNEALGEDDDQAEPSPAASMDEMSDDELAAHYEVVMGKKPHHAAKRETLIEQITEKLNDD